MTEQKPFPPGEARYRYRRPPRERRPPSPTVQLLLDAALDVLGVLCLLALGHGLVGLAVEPAWMVCLGVAGLDLLLRTSLRAALVWVVSLPIRGLKAVRAGRRRRPGGGPEIAQVPGPVPESSG
jgi:hypothetical protein